MIRANFSAFVQLEILPLKPSGPVLELVWIFAGPLYVWLSPEETCMVFKHILFGKSMITIASKYYMHDDCLCHFLFLQKLTFAEKFETIEIKQD